MNNKCFFTTLASLSAIFAVSLFAGTTTDKAGATTIHGDDYKCEWFEDTTFPGDQKKGEVSAQSTWTGTGTAADAQNQATKKTDLLKYAVVASSAYVDRNDRDNGPKGDQNADFYMNGDQGRVNNWKMVDGVSEMPAEKVRDLFGNVAGLNVVSATLEADEVKVGEKATKKADKDCQQNAGWERVETTMVTGKDKDGLSVRVFEENGTIILSFRGTADGKDIRDDIKQVSHLAPTPQQYKDAQTVLQAVLDNPAYKDKKIVCTGHSLGGGLVQYAMASNNIMDSNGNPRVQGYVYNSAGLNGLETVNSFSTENARNAAQNIIGVRNDADPISYVGYHLLQDQKMYEIKSDLAFSKEHSITELIRNMAASMEPAEVESIRNSKLDTGGKDFIVTQADHAQAQKLYQTRKDDIARDEAKKLAKQQKNGNGITGMSPSVTQSFTTTTASAGGGTALPYSLKDILETQISTNPDVQDAFDTTFDKVRAGLDAVLPANAAQTIADKLEELAKKGVVAAGGALDKAVQAQIDKLKSEILELMPGDSSKEQMGKLIDDMIAGIGSGNFSLFGSDAADLGASLAGDYASKLVDGMNLPDAEKNALKKTISDAVQAYINGSGVGGSIKGNIEAYVYGKIQSQFGKDVADAWKNAYYTWQGGGNPWADIGAAAKKTIESWAFQKLEKVIDASLKKLLDKHPVLAEVFSALGIDKNAIMGTIKNIWGVITGPGDLAAKFKNLAQLAVQGLANMLKSLVHWALDKVQQWLNGFLTKIGKKIGEWVKDKLSNLLQKLHLSQSLIDKAMKAIDSAISAGAKYVSSLPSKLEKPIGGLIDKGATKINEKISGKSAGQQSQQPQQKNKGP